MRHGPKYPRFVQWLLDRFCPTRVHVDTQKNPCREFADDAKKLNRSFFVIEFSNFFHTCTVTALARADRISKPHPPALSRTCADLPWKRFPCLGRPVRLCTSTLGSQKRTWNALVPACCVRSVVLSVSSQWTPPPPLFPLRIEDASSATVHCLISTKRRSAMQSTRRKESTKEVGVRLRILCVPASARAR